MTNWEKYYSKEYKEPEIYSDGVLIYNIAAYIDNKIDDINNCIFKCMFDFDSEDISNEDKWKIFFKKYLKWLNEEYDSSYEAPSGSVIFPAIFHISKNKNGNIRCKKEQ